MTNRDSNSSPGSQEQNESVSATGMFLRAYDKEASEKPGEKEASASASASVANAGKDPGFPASYAAQSATHKSSSGGGEFTQFFQTLESKPPAVEGEAGRAIAQATPAKQNTSSEAAPGEFTRSFSGGGNASSGGAAQKANASPVPASRSKGFSTPGVTESASAGGSFTQYFKAAPATPKPAPPVAAVTESAWKPEPTFKPAETQPGTSAQSGSVTSILSSLASPSRDTGSPREPEPVAYRATPVSSAPPAATTPPTGGGDAGGVTRLIKKLAQEQVAAPPPPPVAQEVAPSQEPSEFTRMISKIGGAASPRMTVEQPEAVAPAAASGPVLSVQVQAPQMPQVQPVAPVALAGSAGAPRVSAQVSAPHLQSPVIPVAPKIAPPQPPALAIAPPKSKLEAMVPMLLVINTFLLLIVLVVLIFLIKAR